MGQGGDIREDALGEAGDVIAVERPAESRGPRDPSASGSPASDRGTWGQRGVASRAGAGTYSRRRERSPSKASGGMHCREL